MPEMPEINITDTTPTTVGSLPDQAVINPHLAQLEQTVKRAQDYLNLIETAAAQVAKAEGKVSELLGKASAAQAQADNEALRANQAKVFVEKHSNEAAQLKGALEVDAAAIAAKRAEIESITQSFASMRSSSESDAAVIVSVRKAAEEGTKAVAEASAKASAVMASIAQTKKDIDSSAQIVREETKSVDADLAEVTSAKETSVNLLTVIQKGVTSTNELHERAKTVHASIESLEKGAKAKAESVSELTAKSLELQKKVAEYETNLAELQAGFAAMKDKVEGLLPGATSAGLASAFSAQRKHFAEERETWAKILVGSLGALMVVVIALGAYLPQGVDGWGAIARHLVQRLPYMVPPFWLAVYAGHQHMLATRMEEEYATKEAVSTSFEGYKREMASDPEATKAMCNNVLEIIARRPGLVYEGGHKDVTALSPAIDAMQKLIPTMVDSVVAKLKGVVRPAAE